MEFIDLKTQYKRIEEKVQLRIKQVLESTQFIMGPEVEALEVALAEFSSAKYAITASSGTDALLMIMMAYGIGPGDAVFVPAFTFPATPEVVALLGGSPIFVDVNPRTFNLDVASLKQAIASCRLEGLNPKIILAVDLYGHPADYDELDEIAKTEGLEIVADAAQSFGATYKGKRVGALATCTAVSFFPAKPLGCYGDGGAVLTSNEALADKLKSIRAHGKGQDKYDTVRVGLNARMDTLQAAILLEKLAIFPDEIARRQAVAERYTNKLHSVFSVPEVATNCSSVWAQYTLKLASRDVRARLQSKLKSAGVPTAVYYPKPLPYQNAYKEYVIAGQHFTNAEKLSDTVLSLPMHPYLNVGEQNTVIDNALSFANEEVLENATA